MSPILLGQPLYEPTFSRRAEPSAAGESVDDICQGHCLAARTRNGTVDAANQNACDHGSNDESASYV
jgi:hypothetical protein